jgi:hypothetical protein
MRKVPINLEGFAYKIGDTVDVYVKLQNGKFLHLTGDAKQAKRGHGRATRDPAPTKYSDKN